MRNITQPKAKKATIHSVSVPLSEAEIKEKEQRRYADLLTGADKFSSSYNKLILRDLNNNKHTPSFFLYKKDEINRYLSNPYTYQQQLRNAVVYMYSASTHFRRIIQYFVGLSDLSYVIVPYNVDVSQTTDTKKLKKNYLQTLHIMDSFNVKNTFDTILTVALREDVFYGTMRVTKDNIMIQQLPSDYCDIATIEEGVLNTSFNFSYFDTDTSLLDLYPDEFTKKYNLYKTNNTAYKWQDLDAPTSFAIKCNKDILSYSIPPFVGILRELYEIEDYKQLNLTQKEIENYALLVMKLGMKDGNFDIDYDMAKNIWKNLDSVLPSEVGSVLSPMPIDKISFNQSNTGDVDNVSDAENHLFTAAGVSSLLFNNSKASSNALSLSIKADQAITYGIVTSIENMLNRYLHSLPKSKNFKVDFLDVSRYNREDVGNSYLKACQYGLPMVSYYCASQGLNQSNIDGMHYLENSIMDIPEKFIPLKSSATQSNKSDEVGAPKKGLGDISDEGERAQERDET